MLILIVASGPDKGRIYELKDDGEITLGREGDPVHLSDHKTSRRHARLWTEGGQWYIQDGHSRHGTYVNRESIDPETPSPLHDGDRIHLGRTDLVLSRLPAEQAERLALLSEPAVGKEGVPPRRKGPALAVAAGLAVALMVIGLNVMLLMDNAELREHMTRTREQSSDRVLARIDQLRQRDGSTQAALEEVLASVRSDSQQAMLRRIEREVTKPGKEARPVMDAILSQAGAEQTQARILEDLRKMLHQQGQAIRGRLERVLTATQSNKSNRQALASLYRTLDSRGVAHADANTPARVADKVTDAVDQRLTALEKTLRQQQQTLKPLLKQILAAARAAQANQDRLAGLSERVEALPGEASSPALARQVDAVLTALKRKPEVDQLIEPLKKALADSTGQTREKLQRVLDTLKDRTELRQAVAGVWTAVSGQSASLDQRMKELEQAVAARPSGQKMLARIDRMRKDRARTTDARLEKILDRLNNPDRLESQITKLRQLIESRPPIQPERVDAVLARLKEVGRLGDRVGELETLLKNRPDPESTGARLDKVLLAIEGLKKSLPRTTPLLEQVLAEVRHQPQPQATPKLKASLKAIRTRLNKGLDELSHTLREEIQTTLATSQLAAASRAGEGDVLDDRKGNLSKIEQAYRLAFKTGLPVTIGAGRLNPATGEVSKGKTIDPASARAAGITHWRNWYMMDQYASEHRLQQQARSYARRRGPSVVTFPEPSATPSNPPREHVAE